jgi:hypothetical protein
MIRKAWQAETEEAPGQSDALIEGRALSSSS